MSQVEMLDAALLAVKGLTEADLEAVEALGEMLRMRYPDLEWSAAQSEAGPYVSFVADAMGSSGGFLALYIEPARGGWYAHCEPYEIGGKAEGVSSALPSLHIMVRRVAWWFASKWSTASCAAMKAALAV